MRNAFLFAVVCVLMCALGLFVTGTAQIISSFTTQDYPIEGKYKILNWEDVRGEEDYMWEFRGDSLYVYSDLHTEPSLVQPYIYDQLNDGRRFLYLISYEYMVIFDELGRVQLHQVGGEYPYECFLLEPL